MKCKYFLFCVIFISGCSSNLDEITIPNEKENKSNFTYLSKRFYELEITRLSNKALFESRTVYFSFDSDEISSDYYNLLNFHAHYLIENNIEVDIIAYTDSRGSKEYNSDLRKRRVEAVSDYLKEVGVREGNISIDYIKGIHPPILGESDFVYAKSRKVVLKYNN